MHSADGTRLWWDRATSTRPTTARRPVVVLAAPGGRNSAYWPSSFVSRLVSGGLDVVRFDWRGQGRSDWPPGTFGAEVFVDDLDALLSSALGVQDTNADDPPLYLVGVGLGGWVSARVARRLTARQRRPARLILVGTSGWYSDPSMPGPSEPTVVALVLRRRGGGPGELGRALSREVAVEEARSGPLDGAQRLDEVRQWIDHGFNPADTHRLSWLAAPPAWDALDGLADAVVVLHGELDPVVPLPHGARVADCAGGMLEVLPGVGHHVEETARGRLAELLLAGPH